MVTIMVPGHIGIDHQVLTLIMISELWRIFMRSLDRVCGVHDLDRIVVGLTLKYVKEAFNFR